MTRRRSTEEDTVELSVRLPRAVLEQVILDAAEPSIVDTTHRAALARAILTGRRRRGAVFEDVRFGEASWDIILDIYLAAQLGSKVDVSGLCATSGVPTTTALRHVDMLVCQGFAVREGDPNDARRTFLLMSKKLETSLERWLDYQLCLLAGIGAPPALAAPSFIAI